MIKESIYKRYIPEIDAPEGAAGSDALWFIFSGNRMLVKPEGTGGKVVPPETHDPRDTGLVIIRSQYLGRIDGMHSFSAESPLGAETPQGYEFRDLRSLYGFLEDDLFLVAGRAIQIVAWDSTNQFCSRCGTPVEKMPGEMAKRCPSCGLVKYPQICPAIIVAITRGRQILLAHNKNFQKGLFSVVAGFLEPGETFEDCVRREAREEVGVQVKNIQYFRSQPWPFPNSLMVAFTAEYESGEVQPDGVEIGEAGWYGVENLPTLPSSYSVARQLIDWFIEKYGK